MIHILLYRFCDSVKLCRSFPAGLLQYLAKNMALFVQNFVGFLLLSKSIFGYFMTLKINDFGRATKKRPFLFAASLNVEENYFILWILNIKTGQHLSYRA